MTDPTDEALMQRYANGDDAAFEALFVRHARTLVSTLWCLLAQEEQAIALACQTWRWVHRHRREARARQNFRAWLYTHATALRREVGRATSITASQPGMARPVLDAASLLRALRDLPESYREVIVLQRVAQLTASEVATILGATEEAVKQRSQQGEEQLARSSTGSEESTQALVATLPIPPGTLDRIARSVLPDLARSRHVQRVPMSLVLSGVLLCLCLALLFVHLHS